MHITRWIGIPGVTKRQKAREEDKPILLSIGYAACHWCHVMERESFERPGDPAIDEPLFHQYQDRPRRTSRPGSYLYGCRSDDDRQRRLAAECFLTPAGQPFYGGTYFPPRPAHNRPSWQQVLTGIHTSFQEKKQDILQQAQQLTEHLEASNSFGLQKKSDQQETAAIYSPENLEQVYANLMRTADREEGGFGRAPKFPQVFLIGFLLRHYHFTKKEEALQQACLSLDKMIHGGIYDQVGGGFARYSTDDQWLAPHFEKMLYDNALLITVMAEAFQLTRNETYSRAIRQTMDFIGRELTATDGGFFSALDADSEGVEGKFYVWSRQEVEELLGEDAELFCSYYDITEKGNWEGENILHVRTGEGEWAAGAGDDPGIFSQKMESGRNKLLTARSKRIRPQLDDKILLGWNALMVTASCKAYAALGDEEYKTLAIHSMKFIYDHFYIDEKSGWRHSYKNGEARFPAFLDDYAYLVEALIHLQEITGDTEWLLKARDLTNWVIDHFSEEQTGFFFYTHENQKDVIIRKKEIYDGAVPSGNAVMMTNLSILGIVFENFEWKERAEQAVSMIEKVVTRYPQSFGVWATLLQALTYGIPEIVIVGKKSEETRNLSNQFLRNFIPSRVFQSATAQNDQFPLLKNKPVSDEPFIFLCKDYSVKPL